jgi:hypothetical protein
MNRTFTLIFGLTCLCISFIDLPVQVITSVAFAQQTEKPQEVLSDVQVKTIAQKIAVRIFTKNPRNGQECSGSGFIVQKTKIPNQSKPDKQLYQYQILTNNHVINNLKGKYKIQIMDKNTYSASIVEKIDFQDNDLGLLAFNSFEVYQVARLGNSSNLQPEDKVFVAGFPGQSSSCGKAQFTVKPGIVAPLDLLLLPSQTLIGGYRIGYDNDTSIGSSGGPVLNNSGQVVAVNGKGKSITKPLFGNAPDPYKFTDNTEPDPNIKRFMRYFAWGIPVETYIEAVSKPITPILEQQVQSTTEITSTPTSTPLIENKANTYRLNIYQFDNPLIIIFWTFVFAIVAFLFFIVYKSITDTDKTKQNGKTKRGQLAKSTQSQQLADNTKQTQPQPPKTPRETIPEDTEETSDKTID